MDNLWIWLVVDLPLWKILVNWYDYSQYMEKYKLFQTTNQTIFMENCLSHACEYAHSCSDCGCVWHRSHLKHQCSFTNKNKDFNELSFSQHWNPCSCLDMVMFYQIYQQSDILSLTNNTVIGYDWMIPTIVRSIAGCQVNHLPFGNVTVTENHHLPKR